ncbi:MAG: ABC transporter permease [Steroidobacteraceae bacterium]
MAVAGVPVAAGVTGGVMAGFHSEAWRALLSTPGLGRSMALSAWSGTVATVIGVALAHLALAQAWTSRWSGRLRALSLPLLASPHLALAIGLVLLLSPSGLVLRLLSPWATGFVQPPDWRIVQDSLGLALIGGLVIKETPFIILVLLGALAQVDAERLMMQANTLGYGRLKAWLVAVAPLLHRQARVALAAVLVFGVTNVEMALPLGPTAPPTLSILLLRWFTAADLAVRPRAFAGTWLLLAITVGCLAATLAAATLAKRLWRRWATNGARALEDSAARRGISVVTMALLGTGLWALVALVLRSAGGAWRFPRLVPKEVSLGAWRNVAPDLGASVATTVEIGLFTAAVAVAVVLIGAEALHDRPQTLRRVGFALFVPLLLPQMAFLFGWQVLLVRSGLDGTRFAVSWTHSVFALPYVWSILATARSTLDPGYLVTARLLGASPIRAWFSVTAPLLLRSILLAAAFAFAVSVAVYLPTLFAGAGRVATLATEAAAAIGSGNLRSAAVSAAAQALAPLATFGTALLASHRLFRHRRGVPR